MQPIDGDEKIWSLQYFNQFVEKHSFVVARPGLQVFFKDALRVTNGLKSQLFIRHPIRPVKWLMETNGFCSKGFHVAEPRASRSETRPRHEPGRLRRSCRQG